MDKDLLGQQEVRNLCRKAAVAQQKFNDASQAEVDHICEAMSRAGFRAARRLAESAVSETGMGRVEDKILKNEFATRELWESMRDLRTVGILEHDRRRKVTTIAVPMGVIAGIIPTTNPTSTALYKALITVKSRNALVASPHPMAGNCTLEAIAVMAEAAVRAGAPEGLLACLEFPSLKAATALMHHPDVRLILSTGGSAIVKAAHSSGKPAFGVGPGNVPAFIEASADVPKAVLDIITGKSFDWGVICSSEQAMIVERSIEKKVLAALKQSNAYWVKGKERQLLEQLYVQNNHLNTRVVGQSPVIIAGMAGFSVPDDTRVLIVEQDGVGDEYPLSREKLSPTLAYYTVASAEAGIRMAEKVITYGGIGHTAAIHTRNETVVEQFARRIPASRILVNTPSTHGSVGFTTDLEPAMTLGCGTWGGSITGDNITALHLLNLRRYAWETKPFNSAGVGGDYGSSRRGSYSRYDDLEPQKKPAAKAAPQTDSTPDSAVSENRIEQLARDFSASLDAGSTAGNTDKK